MLTVEDFFLDHASAVQEGENLLWDFHVLALGCLLKTLDWAEQGQASCDQVKSPRAPICEV